MKAAYVSLALTFGSIASNAADVAAPVSSASHDAASQLAFILDNPLKESDYGRNERCLFPRTYESVEILDKRHLLFVGNRDAMWLNQLRNDCVGLRKDSLLIFEVREQSLCDADSFRSAPRNSALSGEFGVHCTLGHFEPITPAQADLLRDAFAKRATTTDAAEQNDD
jgi:hypothetical protein